MPAGPRPRTETDRMELGDRVRDFITDEELANGLPVPAASTRRMTRTEWRALIAGSLGAEQTSQPDLETRLAA